MTSHRLSLTGLAAALALYPAGALSQGTTTSTVSEVLHQQGTTVMGDFETGDASSAVGSWMRFDDRRCCGGSSAIEIEVVVGGAAGKERALAVRGETVANDVWVGAGALLWFSQPVDLSAKSEIVFWAKGAGAGYRLFIGRGEPARSSTMRSTTPGLRSTSPRSRR